MATSSCGNCGAPKDALTFRDDYCAACTAAIAGAQAAASAEGKDLWAAKREALAARAHQAHRNFVDPRSIDKKTIWLMGNAPHGE